jgi:hypothetical protein
MAKTPNPVADEYIVGTYGRLIYLHFGQETEEEKAERQALLLRVADSLGVAVLPPSAQALQNSGKYGNLFPMTRPPQLRRLDALFAHLGGLDGQGVHGLSQRPTVSVAPLPHHICSNINWLTHKIQGAW